MGLKTEHISAINFALEELQELKNGQEQLGNQDFASQIQEHISSLTDLLERNN